MDIRRQKNIPLACRYVAYDQWFLTHVDPTWKVRHLKELILARCFDLPFDPRSLGSGSKDADGGRIPSPITFAPDEGHRPISPIKFANPQELRKKKSGVPSHMSVKDDTSSVGHDTPSEGTVEGTVEGTEEQGKDGYEEDDEWDGEEDLDDDDEEGEDEDDFDTLDDLPSPVFTTGPKSLPSAPGLAGASGRIGSFASTPTASTSFRGQTPSQTEVQSDSMHPPKRKRRFNPLSKLGAKDRRRKPEQAELQHQKEEGIQTSWFTLIRFATGQVIEDDFPLSWYDLAPHELIEMHCSAPLANFAVSAVLSQLIFNNPNAGVVPSHITLSSRGNHLQHQHNAQSLSGPLIKSGIIGSADAASALASALLIPTSALTIANTHVASVASAQSPISLHHSLLRTQNQYFASRSPRLTSLPRMDPELYVQPYWEGWVRTLRKAFKTEAPRIADAPGPGGRGRFEFPEYSGGMGGGGGVGAIGWETAFGAIEGGGHGREKARVRVGDGRGSGREDRWDGYGYHGTERSRPNREEIHYEWRERWAVIKAGYIYLFRNREDSVPAHTMALGALVSVHGADQLGLSMHRAGMRANSSMRQGHHLRPSDHRRSASQPRVSTSTAREGMHRSQPYSNQSGHHQKQVYSHETEETPRSHHHHSDRAPRAPRIGSQTTTSVDRKSEGSGRHKTAAGPSRQLTEEELQAARDRELQREAERAKDAERRRIRERRDKEIESLRKWDDITLPFPFGKAKDKDKDKDKGKGKEKEKGKEKDVGKRPVGDTKSKEEDGKRAEAEREKEKEKERAREKEREKEKAKEREREKERERDRLRQRDKEINNKTYVPESRDEADAAGMKIICARFYSTALWERQEHQRMRHKASLAALEDPLPQPPPRHYTSTGPSLAGAPTNQAIAEEAVYDNAAREDIMYGSGHGHTHSLAPRKASLPGLAGTGTSRQVVVPSVSVASLATTGAASSVGRAESLAIGGTKFGIAGLFGKEADEAARREKDDRKKEEKEKKAREKERKQIEKDKKKAKRKEEEEEDEFGTSSALSWKKTNTKVASGPVAVGTPSGYNSRLPVRDTQSIADTSTVVDSEDHAGTTASVATVRPKLTISPSATPRDRAAAKSDSDSGSSLSISSPVFAHSSDSEGSYDKDDIYGYGKPRQGYRYGGYNPSHMKSPQKAIHGVSNTEGDGNKSESSVGYFAGTKPAVASDSARPQRNERTRTHATTHDHRSQEKAAQKARMEDRGECLVLDMGSEQAFNSILRIFHRHSHSPANSGFLPPSITAAMSLQSTSFNPNEVKSMPNSPIQHSFQPVSTLTRNRDTDSIVTDDRSTLGPSLSSTKATSTTAFATDINDDFDDIYVPIESTAGPSSIQILSEESQQDLAQAFPDLSSKASFQNPTLPPPALPYPEWRTDVVHRARRYGMREAGRPLELAMYGWGRNLVEMETSAVYAKMRKKEESSRQKLRNSIALFNEIAKPSRPVPVPSWEDNSSDTDDHEEDEVEDRRSEDAGTEKDWERSDSKRRMSTVSHVSTIKANPEKAKAKAPVHLTDNEEDTDYSTESHDDAPTERATDESDSDTVPKFEDDKFDAGYAYGLDDEEDALAEGLGSIMGDSEEESEVEWFAWKIDLPRQFIVRQQQAELDRIREEKLREERDLPEFESQPLSPMEFSNPFAGDNSSFISQNVALPTVLPPIPPPKTPEEERRQYAEKRRKLEPSAVSTSQPPPMPSLIMSPRLSPGGSRLTSHHSSTSTSSLQSNQHSRLPSHNIAQGGYHAQRLSNHSSALSSPSSSESLSFARRAATGAAPINIGIANSSRIHSNPMSPLGGVFTPVDDEFEPPSSSTTPPSATGYYYGPKTHRRGHSRSISGSTGDNDSADGSALRPERLTLHHSVSMPFAGSCTGPNIPVSSSPHSPTRATAEKTLTQPISMPILTSAQISEIELEMEEKLKLNAQIKELERATSLIPSPSTSPPSSLYDHYSPRESSAGSHGHMPQRSSSAGFAPGSPPSSSVGGSIGRSASVAVRPLPPHPDEPPRERGVLRKKRSDLGKNVSGSEGKAGDSSSGNSKQRPTLAIVGLSGNNSNTRLADAQSPTQRQHPRGPRSAYPEAQDISSSNSYNAATGTSTSTYQSAKALLRRVRSGSSLGMDMRIEEVSPHAESAQPSWPPSAPPPSTVITNTAEVGNSADSSRKKTGPMDRIVRRLDSALEFVEGR